ncbi:MAG: glycosyltransferase [Lentimicrobium sp.]
MHSGQTPQILYLARWYPSGKDPMPGLFVKKHAMAAVEAGFRVTVIFVVPDLTVKSHELFSTEVKSEDGLTEIIVSYRKSDGMSGLARQLIAWNLGVKTAVNLNGKPVLIHAHVLTRTALLAWYYGRKWHVPYLITEHWSRYYPENFQYKGRLRKMLTRFAVRNSVKTTVVSDRLAKAMQQAGVGDNFNRLPNVVDTRLFKLPEIPFRKTRIISITCFEEKSKNLRLLIDAFAMLAPERKELELLLVGEGADLEATKQYVAQKKLPYGAIRFTGLLEGEELVHELQQSACLTLTSNYETFGIVAYEAMACGVPVVTTDVADLKSFVKHNSGRVVPVQDVNALVTALSEVLDHPKGFDGAEMRKMVEQDFGFEAVTKYLKSLYNEILQKKQI